ncbi:MAG: hypothetical protein N3D74_02035 [Caldisericia bacterium]|nr:hypothetical protein [Caldisericia bacterium]
MKEIKEKLKGNFLILPFPFEHNYLEIIKNYLKGEIFTETLNLFYFIKRDFDIFEDKIYKYELDPINQEVKINIFDLKFNEVQELKEKAFTPKGVFEFLEFNGFKVKEISGDELGKGIKDNSIYLILRFEKI